MKMRITWPKLIILMAMSAFGLWASGMVVVVFWLLKQNLPFCPSGGFDIFGYFLRIDCNSVLGSKYSSVYGVPLELFAVAYFVINLGLVYLIAFGSERLFSLSLKVLFAWRFLGLIIVPYLVFIELAIIKAICVYCTIMHIAIVLDFVIISYFLFYKRASFVGVSQDQSSRAAEPTP